MDDSIKKIWEDTLVLIKEELTEVSYNTWLKTLEPVKIINDNFYLMVQTDFYKDILINRYSALISNAIKQVTSIEYNIEFIIPGVDDIISEQMASYEIEGKRNTKFNPKYTFRNFVVGDSNKLAYDASILIAESPGKSYNPLFIYGGVGLGKTHLLESIRNHITDQNRALNIVYLSCDNLINESINSNEDNNSIEFRNEYRDSDVLIIDDIQLLSAKDSYQDELLNIINNLYDNNKQIIISSDRALNEIIINNDQLSSRLIDGIIISISKPSLETRIAILKMAAEINGINISDEVISLIASEFKSDIRKLKGTLVMLEAYSILMDEEMSVQLAETVIDQIERKYTNEGLMGKDYDCQGNGFLEDSKKCHYDKKELIKLHYKYFNQADVLERENFDTFDINIFPDNYNEELQESPRDHMTTILAECESFVHNFKKKDNRNLIFSGSTGLGKTFLCNCIAKALLDEGATVFYQTAFRIIDTVSAYRFANKKTNNIKFNYDLLIECDLLIIDDLGTEMMNSFTNTELFNIINARLLENRKTIISTNFTHEHLENNYSSRISSRINGYYKFIEFIGEDLRWPSIQ